MNSSRNTIIPIAVGLILAIVLQLVGLDWSAGLIIGAIVAIGVSIFLQRQLRAAESDSSSTGTPTSAADIDALLATGASAVSGFVTSAGEIANPSTKEIAGKIGANLQGIMTALNTSEKRSAAPVVIDNLIEPAQSVLTEYLFLTKKAIAAATPRTTTIEQSVFPAIESASRQTLSLLEEPGTPDLTKLSRASTVPFEQTVTMPPGGATPKGSREIKPGE
ncbi:MAG: hypothetical protein KC438_12275 [Thermomicrobiales bacterium]|nr:hypothetical protein [Thermomicrobiales bacterium]MCO5221823.1 hypothetical protein [Thermomicrobiales bacterium]